MNVKITEYPYRYKAFALNVFSQIPLTGLARSGHGDADILISEGNVPLQLDNPLNRGVLFQATENEFLLKIDGIARYYAVDGKNITVEKEENTAWNDVSAFLLGTVFGALLHQRRLLPLHGSSVIYKNKGLVFSGISGVGKSTLAAAFIDKGARLLADDITVISLEERIPKITPAFPGMKIWEDSLIELGKNPEKLHPIRSDLKKYFYPVKHFYNSSIEIDHLFMLSTHNLETFELKKISGIEKFNLLKNNTYFFKGMNKTGILQQHFALCNALAQFSTVTQIIRPTSRFRIKELVNLIEKTIFISEKTS